MEAWITRLYPDTNGEPRNVNLCCIDSGFHAEEEYYFCVQHSSLAILTKGASRPGSWNLYDEIDRRYADMICAEQKV